MYYVFRYLFLHQKANLISENKNCDQEFKGGEKLARNIFLTQFMNF